jgi:trans-L-3-hydroxyproline dehydratase
VKVGVETGAFEARQPRATFKIDTPAGRVVATAHVEEGRVQRVSFLNVPSFVLLQDLEVEVPDLGAVHCHVAFGGAFYAYVDAGSSGVTLEPAYTRELIDVGMRIKRAVMESTDIRHPAGGDPGLNFLYGTIFVQLTPEEEIHSRNVCIFADGEVDRCPTGTGVSGRLALHHARGELAEGETIVVESIVGTRFSGRIVDTTDVQGLPAVVPEITGTAHITGRHEFVVDPDDPLAGGFLLR